VADDFHFSIISREGRGGRDGKDGRDGLDGKDALAGGGSFACFFPAPQVTASLLDGEYGGSGQDGEDAGHSSDMLVRLSQLPGNVVLHDENSLSLTHCLSDYLSLSIFPEDFLNC
jgi:hypothetical protein